MRNRTPEEMFKYVEYCIRKWVKPEYIDDVKVEIDYSYRGIRIIMYTHDYCHCTNIIPFDLLESYSCSEKMIVNYFIRLEKELEHRKYKNIINQYNKMAFHTIVPDIKNVIFNDPATIVIWSDGTKTVVKCQGEKLFDKEKGLAMAIAKKAFGNTGNYYNEFKKYMKEDVTC